MKTHKIFWLGWAVAVALIAPVRAATVTASLDPAQISLGDSAQLTVTVSGSQEQPTLPNIDGLVIQQASQSFQSSWINGVSSNSVTITYQVTPQRAGTFTIPALIVGNVKSDPVTLQVLGAGATAQTPAAPAAQMPPPASGAGPVVMPPNGPTAQDDTATTTPQNKYGFIQIVIPKEQFYEGELAPVEIKILVPDGTQAKYEVPTFTSDGFTLNSLGEKPEQGQEVIANRVYDVLTWHSALTAVKAGDFPIKVSESMQVLVPMDLPDMNDTSADPFAAMRRLMQNNAFGGTAKGVTLTNAPETLKVMPLPQAGRPADFGGAVGTFEADASATPDKVTAGDPVTLKLRISGVGNFDRVSSDMLPGDANWKTYTPKSHFDELDSAGYQGTKTFEQPIIPNNGSITSVPSLSFSYFDPEKRQYATITTPPVPISVSGAPAAPAPAPSASASVAAANPAPASPVPVPAASDLRMNRIDSGAFVSTLEPVYRNPLFVTAQALPLVALLGGLAFLRRHRMMSHPDRARLTATQAAIREQVNAMDAALRDAQAEAFFVHARTALQQRYGQQWKMRPEAITVADVEARLGTASPNVRSIFEMADQASYSDLHFGEADLQKWREVVVNELAETK